MKTFVFVPNMVCVELPAKDSLRPPPRPAWRSMTSMRTIDARTCTNITKPYKMFASMCLSFFDGMFYYLDERIRIEAGPSHEGAVHIRFVYQFLYIIRLHASAVLDPRGLSKVPGV